MQNVRDSTIDVLKGFLILLVVLAHNGGSHHFILEFCHPAIMGMFFMVSGYLLHGKLRLSERLIGTCLPFLFFVFVSVLWRYSYGFISNETLDFKNWSIELLYGRDWGLNIPLWFLLSYMQLLLLVYFLGRFSSSIKKWISVLLLMIVGLEMLRYRINPLYLGRTLEYLPFFMIGDELHNMSRKFPEGRYPFITLLLIGVLIWGRLNLPQMDYYERWFLDAILAMVFTYLLYNLFKNKYFPLQFFAFYGRNSMVVLCMHILMLDVIWRVWWHKFGQPGMIEALLQTLLIVCALYPCCIIYSRHIGPKLR